MYPKLMGAVVAGLLLLQAGLLSSVSAGVVGYWQFDEGKGTIAADSSGNSHDGFFEGAPKWTAPGWNDAGWCLAFGGVDDRVTVEPFDVAGSGIALAAWLKPNTFKDDARILSKAADSGTPGHYWAMVLSGTGENNLEFRLKTNVGDASRFTAADAYDLVAGEWTHIAVTWDAADPFMRQYKNGEQVRSDGKAGTAVGTDPSVKISIGNQSPSVPAAGRSRPFDGLIDEVLVTDRGLTQSQVTNLANGILPDWRKAADPDPADGAEAVNIALLQWTPGETAIFHKVYLGKKPQLGPDDLVGPNLRDTFHYHTAGLEPGTAYYWRVDEVELDGTTIHTGDVWTFITQALTAYYPTPADGAADVSLAPTLTWLGGRSAYKHHLYFSDSNEAVSQGAAEADKGEMAETSFAPGDLDPATTYYWRVDEIVALDPLRVGPVWTFSTYLPVEDFESYNDDEGKGTRIYETWIDGLINVNGSMVGYWDPPFAERTLVHGGLQSMPLDYNNTAAPFYSEAEREFTSAQDWTINDVNTLVLFVRGNAANGPAPLYLRLEDASTQRATVVHPDPAVVTLARWTEWRIPLSDFAGVNALRIRKICLGVGDRADPKPGGAGLLLVDDIYVRKP